MAQEAEGQRKGLRALLIEDSAEDADLLQRTLTRGGFDVSATRVDNAASLRAALDEHAGNGHRYDVVFCDYELPGFDAVTALEIVRAREEHLPFIVVSGRIGEEVAVEIVRRGASDYLLKQNLARLSVALERALGEAQQRREQAVVREQLVVAERMATVGTLAAGLVHEINNPLSSLLFNLEYIAATLSHPPDKALTWQTTWQELEDPLTEAREACAMVMAIAADVKMFARRAEPESSAVSLAEVVDSAARLARVAMRTRARFVREFGEVLAVAGERGRLAQVCLNLLMNAAQAIPEGNAQDNEIRAVICRGANPEEVELVIRDTGPGIPPEIAARLRRNEALTTKGAQGTGLGLSICRRLLEEIGGRLTLESKLGAGTSVHVFLPVAKLEPVGRDLGAPAPTRARASILVVDDDPLIARIIERALGPDHDPVCVARGDQALDLIRRHGRSDGVPKFDAVVCDLAMPGMSGIELHTAIEGLAPRLARATLFLTGGAYTDKEQAFLSARPGHYLEKPFQPEALRRAVARMLA